ncbi:YajQ family cyclic di-GMP-binding protein [Candidatus Pelagibacter sp.]|nr:YajQ family cyclic di-GMP-binding protein [Candidatus Pelagibacter sp.]
MPSFDIISKINYQEFDNALANCLREISNRYDFKGLNISIERKDKIITILAPDELKLKQVNELLQIHLIRRKVDPRVISIKNSENAAGSTIRQVSELKEGISQENAKKIIADVKKLKLKIQIKIQGEELRAEGKKRDDLQEAISAIEVIDIGLPIEFINFRD